jgi:hypothetical protein
LSRCRSDSRIADRYLILSSLGKRTIKSAQEKKSTRTRTSDSEPIWGRQSEWWRSARSAISWRVRFRGDSLLLGPMTADAAVVRPPYGCLFGRILYWQAGRKLHITRIFDSLTIYATSRNTSLHEVTTPSKIFVGCLARLSPSGKCTCLWNSEPYKTLHRLSPLHT